MTRSDVEPARLVLLQEGEAAPIGYLSNASNATLYCQLGGADSGVAGVYKPEVGERPLWDFPTGTLCRREVAAYAISRALGWDLVPPTVLRDGPMGIGSMQLFVPHDPRQHYFVLVEQERHHAQLARMVLFDLLVNNTDRKGGHVLLGEQDQRVWGIDHGVTFHPQPKLRTVMWELGGRRIDDGDRADLERLAESLHRGDDPLRAQLGELLSAREIAVTAQRAGTVAGMRALPDLPPERRPYPWPPI